MFLFLSENLLSLTTRRAGSSVWTFLRNRDTVTRLGPLRYPMGVKAAAGVFIPANPTRFLLIPILMKSSRKNGAELEPQTALPEMPNLLMF